MDRPRNDAVCEVIAKARAGDREALNRLLLEYTSYLRQTAQHRLHSHRPEQPDCSDVVQDTLLEAFRDFGQFAGQNETDLKAWLRHVLVHNLMDEARRCCAAKRSLHRQRYLEEVGWPNLPRDQLSTTDDSTPSAIARHHETEAELLSAINRLPPDYRMVVALRQFGAMRFPEISALMGRSEAAVRKLWLRSLQQLADALARVR